MKIRELFKPKIAVVLGGGGAGGLSHVGVLAVLEAEGIKPDMIVGTSIGALVGGLYCAGGSSEKVYGLLSKFVKSDSFDNSYFRKIKTLGSATKGERGFLKKIGRLITMGRFAFKTATKESYIPSESFKKNIEAIISERAIESLGIKLAIVAADLKSGEEVVIESGNLRSAIEASVAVAGILPSAPFDGKRLIDGGYVNQVPVEVAFRLSADVVIAADVSQKLVDLQSEKITGGQSSLRAATILSDTAKRFQLRFADVVISPDLKELDWMDFDKINDFVERGVLAANESLPEIRRAIRKAGFKKPFWAVFGRKWKVDLRKGKSGTKNSV